jgi:4-hydroxy-2-oxoheptanedioate aldolase
MTAPGLRLAKDVRAGNRVRLLIVKMPCPAEIELAGHVGFDAVVIDTEHGPAPGAELDHHLRAADAAGIPALVRIGAADPAEIQRALDAGAAGVVAPRVATAAAAGAVVTAAHYPPAGERGLALTTRAGRYATADMQTHLESARATLVIVQIEDGDAAGQADEILSVDGVDAVLIGATDLSAALGHPGDSQHPEVRDAIAMITTSAGRAGVPVAEIASTPDDLERLHGNGTPIAVFVATLLMREAFRAAAGPAAGS